MLLTQILLLAGLALLLRLAGRGPLRGWLIFAASVLAVYALQPALAVRNLGFWLATATLALGVLGWLLTAAPGSRLTRTNLAAGAVLAGLVLVAGLSRYLGSGDWLAEVQPPSLPQLLPALLGLVVLFSVLAVVLRNVGTAPHAALSLGIIVLVALLVVLKTPALSFESARGLRILAGQNPSLATVADVRWLGFSYLCFRLIHTLRDRQTGRLPAVDLRTYLSYLVFFPALIAGPIDRLERFSRDFCESARQAGQPSPAAVGIVARPLALPADPALAEDLGEAGRRLTIGLFKKFAIADTLALVALSPANALQVQGTGWLWLLLYLYAFQIYFDFSGYTDIAIGIGRAMGIRLPENFDAPYRKPNLTQFWNSWHMSLTLWFRAYFFNPLVRRLRAGRPLSPAAVLLLSQVSTMLLIGLWHGVTWNFAAWGLWHGLGLFAQNRWSERTRSWFAARAVTPGFRRVLSVTGALLTFHYVALGWVWFVLPAPEMAGQVFARLAGVGW